MNQRTAYFLNKAQENMPTIYHQEIRPSTAFYECKKDGSVTLDLGDYYVGHFSFSLNIVDDFISAPVRLKIRFAENKRELDDDYSTYNGTLCANWFQEEIIHVDYPMNVRMPRRYACRYIKINVFDARNTIRLSDFCFTASTSANENQLKPLTIKDTQLNLIDQISTKTLKNCMQTFFEDGPKRDRRLWIGDLRIEALTNYVTYNCLEVVRRSLYLIATGDYNKLGFLPSYIYETPFYFSGGDHITDYALLFVVSVCDYYKYTNDESTVLDLLDVCKEQLQAMENILDKRGIVTPQEGWFTFIDWCEGLHKLTALQGVYLYTLEKFSEMLKQLNHNDYIFYENRLLELRKASLNYLFNQQSKTFVNELDHHQKSVHSQVWMILGGVLDGQTAQSALLTMLNDTQAKQPFTPYMRHYVIEAMLKCGMKNEALDYIRECWGGMLSRGIDTFPEVYVPNDIDFSPYEDRMINSNCHAWSCSPAYFIRTVFEECNDMNYWKQSKEYIYVAAHRGWKDKYPENTLESFKAALDLGVDQLETDIRITKDNELVLIHDETIDRTTNGNGKVREYTLEQLKEFDAGNGTQIPTFIELMELVKEHPTITLDIELKEYPVEGKEQEAYQICDRVLHIIDMYGFSDRCVINSWNGKLNEYIYKTYKNKYKQHVYFPQKFLGTCEEDPYKYAYCTCLIGLLRDEYQPEEAKQLQRDTHVRLWAGRDAKDEQMIDRYLDMGIELITCDNPDEVLSILRRKGLHR